MFQRRGNKPHNLAIGKAIEPCTYAAKEPTEVKIYRDIWLEIVQYLDKTSILALRQTHHYFRCLLPWQNFSTPWVYKYNQQPTLLSEVKCAEVTAMIEFDLPEFSTSILVTGHHAGAIHTWDSSENKSALDGSRNSLFWSNNQPIKILLQLPNKKLASATDRAIYIFDYTGVCTNSFSTIRSLITAMIYITFKGQPCIVISYTSGNICFWNYNTNTNYFRKPITASKTAKLAKIDSGKFAFIDDRGFIKVFDCTHDRLLPQELNCSNDLNTALAAIGSQKIVYVGLNRNIYIWNWYNRSMETIKINALTLIYYKSLLQGTSYDFMINHATALSDRMMLLSNDSGPALLLDCQTGKLSTTNKKRHTAYLAAPLTNGRIAMASTGGKCVGGQMWYVEIHQVPGFQPK